MRMDTRILRGYPTAQRLFAGGAFTLAGIFFLYLIHQSPDAHNSWIGYVMGGACFWLAAYWFFLPRVLVVLRPEGMDYHNEDLALLFIYPWFHITWDQIIEIQTHEETGKSGPVMVTTLHARDPRTPVRTRTFRINSTNMNYKFFLEYLKDSTNPDQASRNSIPLEPDQIQSRLRLDRILQMGAMILSALAFLLFVLFIRK